MFELLGVGASLVGGFLGKKLGKSEKVGGAKPWQKVLAPVAAVGTAMAFEALTGSAETGQTLMEAAGQTGGTAIVVHTLAKNALQLVRGR